MQNQSFQEVEVQILTFVHREQRRNLGDVIVKRQSSCRRRSEDPPHAYSLMESNRRQQQHLLRTSVPPTENKVLYLFITVAHTCQLFKTNAEDVREVQPRRNVSSRTVSCILVAFKE